MQEIDLNAPATLKWLSKEIPRERSFLALKDAVRVAMHELRKGEFLSAHIASGQAAYAGDQIVEIFQTGGLARRGYARF
jgi:hypothetical protein